MKKRMLKVDNKFPKLRGDLFRLFIVILGSAIYAIGMLWFIIPLNMYAGGVNGIAQLIVNLIEVFITGPGNVPPFLSVGTVIAILNIPILIIGWKNLSSRFIVFSIISVAVQTLCLSGLIPAVDFGINGEANFLINSIIGGMIMGFGGAIALKYGTSTGGVDIISQVIEIKYRMSVGMSSMVVNIFIAIAGGACLYGNWEITMYTFIRIIAGTLVYEVVHTSYRYVRIDIICTAPQSEEIADIINEEFFRGCTILHGEGAYSKKDHKDVFLIVSNFETTKIISRLKQYDSFLFITTSPINKVYGNFVKKHIA